MPGDKPVGMVNEVVSVLPVPGGRTGTLLCPSEIDPEARVALVEKKKLVVVGLAPPDPILKVVSTTLTVLPALAAPGAFKEVTARSGVGD
jgi:hypothetical protein